MRHSRTTLVGAAALLLVGGLTGTASASGGSGGDHTEVIEMEDDCDPVTFPAVAGCVPGEGDMPFPEFFAEFKEKGKVGAWRFAPDHTHIDVGEDLLAVNAGDELHTFTKVERFSNGCVALFDRPGLAPFPDCSIFVSELMPAGGPAERVTGLTAGTHRFMCLIHPWMRTVVEVRR